jgi:hypothetical protein
MSFSCPHYDFSAGRCFRLDAECVPGRPGCVLGRGTEFAVPLEERMKRAPAKKAAPKQGRSR